MKRTNAGFSLVEVMVTMAVFAIAAAAIASQMFHATATISENNQASEAIALAQQALEDLRTLDYQDMATDSKTVTWKGKTFTVAWKVTEDEPEAGMKTIVVTVSWDEKGKTKSYATQSIYSQITA